MVAKLAALFPAVLILGARQCGKTTLARGALKGEYFDLEKPSDLQVFQGDPELVLRRFRQPVILDEAQTLPELFPVLRALIDERRRETGRFFLLGSVSPVLVEQISESLAGRVGIVELTPFLLPEARETHLTLSDFWLRGGFPDACRAQDESQWTLWLENYLRTFVERDVARIGARASPIEMRRFLAMLAHYHGNVLNASELGRSLSASYHTAQRYLDILEGHYLLRRLPSYHASVKKRLVKSPKVYLRDSGLLHHLLGISSERSLLESPKRGASWEGLMVEQVIMLETLARPSSRPYFYRTHTGAEVDLVLDRGNKRTGYEFKCAMSVAPQDAAHLKEALADGVIDEGLVIHHGDRRFPLGANLSAVGAEECLRDLASP